MINLFIILFSLSYFFFLVRFLAVHLSRCHASHTAFSTRIGSLSLSISLSQNCIAGLAALTHTTLALLSLLSWCALLRSSALPLSLSHSVRGWLLGQSKATVIKCVRLQLKHATCFKPSPALLIHPLSAPSPSLYHSLPACDPCRRHHHNKAVSCCSDFGCFGTQTARATFVCLPSIFTIILTHTHTLVHTALYTHTHTNTCKTNIDFYCLHMKIFEHFYCFLYFFSPISFSLPSSFLLLLLGALEEPSRFSFLNALLVFY